jgi:8-hydroxy-5-deazaflavin:NADPH oxidoreductase
MQIAILGAGNIGGTLGAKWAGAGHEVVFGARDPGSDKARAALEAAGRGVRIGSLSEAAAFGEVVLFSIPSRVMEQTTQTLTDRLDEKILIDATNNFGAPVINSLAHLRAAAPTASLFRAFNSLGWELFADPQLDGQQVDLFYSGPEGEARHQVEALITEIGLRPIWVGDNDQAHLVDNLGALWVNQVFRHGWPRRWAFKALGRVG